MACHEFPIGRSIAFLISEINRRLRPAQEGNSIMFQLQAVDRSATEASGTRQYSELLLKEKARVQSELRGRLEILHSGPVAVEDQAPVVHEQFVWVRFNNFAHQKIKAINAALERLKRGQYGICEECEGPISEKRLNAVPWARYCLHCEQNFAAENTPPFFRRLRAA
jgi:DnaK suppressor protein